MSSPVQCLLHSAEYLTLDPFDPRENPGIVALALPTPNAERIGDRSVPGAR